MLIEQPVTSLGDISDQVSHIDVVTPQDQMDDGIDEEFVQRGLHASFSVTMRHVAFLRDRGQAGICRRYVAG
jgi:hypothetical protein